MPRQFAREVLSAIYPILREQGALSTKDLCKKVSEKTGLAEPTVYSYALTAYKLDQRDGQRLRRERSGKGPVQYTWDLVVK